MTTPTNLQQTIEKAKYYSAEAAKVTTLDQYSDWVNVALALSDLGEEGRPLFHQVSSTSSKYDFDDADKKFTNALSTRNGSKGIGSFFQWCTSVLHIPKFRPATQTAHNGYRQTDNTQSNVGVSMDTSLLDVRPANIFMQEASKRPVPKKLYREFWYEGELCILFADTNTGKSILAVQISDEISRTQPVMVCDFELSDKQFQIRYTDEAGNSYRFNDNFFRAEINPDADLPQGMTFEEYLNASLEREIQQTGIRILVIDNITYLRTQTEKSHEALPLMKSLKRLKAKYSLSILCLAHTPKRDMTKPITRNDLQGSKMLINFCDSAFAIGESTQDKAVRYLKQIKARNTEIIYDTDNVITCHLRKNGDFLGFDPIGFGREADHLMQLSEKQREDRMAEVLDLKSKGMSNVEIGSRFGVSEGAVRKWMKTQPRTNSYPSNPSTNGTSSTSQLEIPKECPF